MDDESSPDLDRLWRALALMLERLEQLGAAHRVLESVAVCLAATHPQGETLLKLIEQQMEFDVAEDLNQPIYEDQIESYEQQRARLLKRFRTVCRAKP